MNVVTRLEELREECQAFHDAHPEVWELFVRFTNERISRGFKRFSSDAIFHRIRWETAKPKYKPGEEFKLNDHHTAFYGRRFMRMYPQHEGFFITRVQISADADATGRAPPAPDYLQ